MTVKFIQFFDILSGREDEFNQFALNTYIPGVNAMGFLKIVGSWWVSCGEGPYCVFESVADSVKNINSLLQEDEFGKLNHLLHFLITNYKTKILAPAGSIESEIPAERHFRFNHHYNIEYDRLEEYMQFFEDQHLPTMEKLGIKIIGAWRVAIGPGPYIVTEGRCSSVKQILQAIGSAEYRELTSKIFTMVTDFGSKILVPTGLTP